MCGVCGVLGGAAHWSSGHKRVGSAQATTSRADRARTVGLLNRIARTRGFQIHDWHGSSFVIVGPTGAQEIVDSLALVWAALDRLSRRVIDPLADEWLDPDVDQEPSATPATLETGGA